MPTVPEIIVRMRDAVPEDGRGPDDAELSNYVVPDILVCVAASPGQNVPGPLQVTDSPSEPAQGRGRLPGGNMRSGGWRSYIMVAEPG